MKKPKRIQRKRTKGWKMPPNTVYVGRPSKWGNPFAVGKSTMGRIPNDSGGAVCLFRQMIEDFELRWRLDYPRTALIKHKLKGKNLACWCPLDQRCHADVLLELANA